MARIHVFPTGKLPPETLKKIVFRRLGTPSDRVLLGPSIGEDAAVIDVKDGALIVTTDPITGALGNIGWLAIHVNANDVATRGTRPQWFFCTILLPEGADERLVEEMMTDMDRAARELGVAIVGGHTEITPGLERPIIIGFMLGESPRDGYVSTRGVRNNDALILTKAAGIEGTAVLASDLADVLRTKVSAKTLQRARRFLLDVSVVREALEAMRIGGVHSMHDPTEGGVINGIWEMAEAAQKGVEVHRDRVKVAPETEQICRSLEIDPLKTLGSGALLIAAEPSSAEEIVRSLRDLGIDASVIGRFTPPEEGRWIVDKNGNRDHLVPPQQDEVYKVLSRHGVTGPQT